MEKIMEDNQYIDFFEKYLRNDISESELQLLAGILRNNRQIQVILDNELINADPEIDKETSKRLFASIHASISPKRNSLFTYAAWRKTLRWAAVILLPVISALSVYFLMTTNLEDNAALITVTADKGEKAAITLADGSRVWLNSESSLSYNETFNRRERNVYLTGEAYFEVVKDTQHPFTVKTREMDIQALGTSFNVSAYDDEQIFSSILLEGKVKVTAYGQECILEENERALYNKRNQTLTTDWVHASDFVEWKNGNLYFQNRSFEEIANTLSRVFNVDIRFVSDELRSIRFSGTLGSNSIRNTLDILSLTSPMHYEMNGTTIELYYRD
ncbi:FecR protein [Porphyromonadaceae bacterium KH3CP3RA]|nr:FecR protein [Porphyromonadaceae bacterium KH3CP3RA]